MSEEVIHECGGPGGYALECFFGLSYSSWLTVPRVLMRQMPDEWQERMAALMNEYYETFPNQPPLGTRVQITDMAGKLTKTPDWVVNYRYPDFAAIDELRAKCGAFVEHST